MSLTWWLAGGAGLLVLVVGPRLLPDDFDTRSGSLVDAATGAPVAGATVVASWSGFTDAFRNRQAVAHVEVAVTDAKGRWRLAGWPPGRDTTFRDVRVQRWAAAPGRPVAGVAVALGSSTSRMDPVAADDKSRAEGLRDAFMHSKVFGSLARDGSGEALVPLQLALIAGMEQLPPTAESLDTLTWARTGVAATRHVAGAAHGSR